METVTQENATNNENQVENKTFTQAELDNIVADRLKRERAKYEGFDELKEKAAKFDEFEAANKSELQKATERAEKLELELNTLKKAESVRTIREKVATETGVPTNLLTAETEEDCKKAEETLALERKKQEEVALQKSAARKEAAKKVEDAYKDLLKAKKTYNEEFDGYLSSWKPSGN